MWKKTNSFFGVVLTVLAGACTKASEPGGEIDDSSVTISSKLTQISGLEYGWKDGDKISVFDGASKRCVFTADKVDSPSKASFKGSLTKEASNYYAVYPSNYQASLVGRSILYEISSSQQAVFGPFSPEVMPAFAKGSDEFEFSYGCALLSFTVGSANVKSVTLSSNDPLSGKAYFTCSQTGVSVQSKSGVNSVSLSGTTLVKGTKYYISVLPGTHSGVRTSCVLSDGSVCAADFSSTSLTVEGGRIYDLGTISSTGTANPDEPKEGQIAGYLKYSDGSPAEGVSVSDGFSVAVTDSRGYYILNVNKDCWFIYFSYPSDAKITWKAGSPEFFRRYDKALKYYNFTFERITPEKKFALFTFADPQAHYSKRGPQHVADTDRFRDEAVPGINAQISAQDNIPCYGVTLGDIVYSEDSRNSNKGLPIMHGHISKINMPVFQVMGNHDYSYFYGVDNPLATDDSTSTLYLKAQRAFEREFGPVNYSFNRGDVHVVCMRNIIYNNTTDAGSYHGGFTDAQYAWLQADLANVPTDKMVVLCIHIPFAFILNRENAKNVLNLISKYKNTTIFSGHTHFYQGVSNLGGTSIFEHIHSAVCGQWWFSKIGGDGCPNGYNIYKFDGTGINDGYFIGFNEKMDYRDYQIRIYKGNMKTGGDASFQWPHTDKDLLINVFNGDKRWTVKVYEDGVLSGNATLMSMNTQEFPSIVSGQTYSINASSSQDWWAIGYHIGVVGRGRSNTAYYTDMSHMYKFTRKSATSNIKVEAKDPYGNVYTCSEIMETCYPDYIKIP